MKKKLLKITMIFLLILYLGIVNAFPTFSEGEVATTWDITNVSGLDTFPSGQTVTTKNYGNNYKYNQNSRNRNFHYYASVCSN